MQAGEFVRQSKSDMEIEHGRKDALPSALSIRRTEKLLPFAVTGGRSWSCC